MYFQTIESVKKMDGNKQDISGMNALLLLRSGEDIVTNIMITILIGALLPVGLVMGLSMLYKIFV